MREELRTIGARADPATGAHWVLAPAMVQVIAVGAAFRRNVNVRVPAPPGASRTWQVIFHTVPEPTMRLCTRASVELPSAPPIDE